MTSIVCTGYSMIKQSRVGCVDDPAISQSNANAPVTSPLSSNGTGTARGPL